MSAVTDHERPSGPDPGDERFLIVCTGRDGSTLLSAILAAAGANFGEPEKQDWDPRAGAYESWTAARASAHYNRFIDLNEDSFLSRWMRLKRRYHRIWAKALAKRYFSRVHFAKIGAAHRFPQLVRLVGFRPVIVLLYRDYHTQFASAFVRKPFSYDELVDKYFSTLATGLISLSLYGGCILRYEEVIDPDARDWANRLGEACRIPPERLLQARAAILKRTGAVEEANPYVMDDARLDGLMARLDELRPLRHVAGRLGERV
ncbi:MAG: hypothetical protein AB1899_00145 [Pseudomonadota bacterium]